MILRVSGLAIAAAAWIIAAVFLARTSVPGSLHLRHVDVSSTFGAAATSRAARYERFGNWDWLLSQLTLLVVLAAYARFGARYVRESAAGRIGTGMRSEERRVGKECRL